MDKTKAVQGSAGQTGIAGEGKFETTPHYPTADRILRQLKVDICTIVIQGPSFSFDRESMVMSFSLWVMVGSYILWVFLEVIFWDCTYLIVLRLISNKLVTKSKTEYNLYPYLIRFLVALK